MNYIAETKDFLVRVGSHWLRYSAIESFTTGPMATIRTTSGDAISAGMSGGEFLALLQREIK